ncbi:MAG: hypothetical protein K9N23_08905 [Akkermansiaceae bacterium]|nr:hypothetical protein [Akkermansiaceae bacterium]
MPALFRPHPMVATLFRIFRHTLRFPLRSGISLLTAITCTSLVLPTVAMPFVDVVIKQRRPDLIVPTALVGLGAIFPGRYCSPMARRPRRSATSPWKPCPAKRSPWSAPPARGNPPLLLLADATSALDNRTERLVQDALEGLRSDRTCFVIAHRLSTVRKAHRICVLDHGALIEQGTHEQLLALNGAYARLCEGSLAVSSRQAPAGHDNLSESFPTTL